jgi:hypothetical protein
VAALKEPPTPSIASLSERVEGYAAVLQEVGDAFLLGRFEARPGEDVGRDRDGSGAGQPRGDDPRALGQRRLLEHRSMVQAALMDSRIRDAIRR